MATQREVNETWMEGFALKRMILVLSFVALLATLKLAAAPALPRPEGGGALRGGIASGDATSSGLTIHGVLPGAKEVTAANADPNGIYLLFYWAKGSSSAVKLAILDADAKGELDFKGLTQNLSDGDTLRVLTAADASSLLKNPTADESSEPSVTVGAPATPSSVVIAKATAGDEEVNATKAEAYQTYLLFDWAKPVKSTTAGSSASAKPVKLGMATAAEDGTLDFTGLSQPLGAGDTIRALDAADASKLLAALAKGKYDWPELGVVVADAPVTTTEAPKVIVGYEQSGANSADSSGRLYADVYYSHALRHDPNSSEPARMRIFGDVRIGSSAQSASSTIGTFVTGLSGTVSSLKLNQVASVAEFLTGLEYSFPKLSQPDGARLSIFGEYGAQGALQSAELSNTYAFPANTTQAYQLLVAAEKSTQGPNPATSIPTTCVVGSKPTIPGVANNCMFLEFSQQQPYFNQEAYLGVKSVSFLTVGKKLAPDVISIGFGANNSVNRNMNFNAMRIEGLVPFALPTGTGSAKPAVPMIYLFGYANLAIDHSHFPNVNNFIPLNASSSVIVNNQVQTSSANNTYVIYTKPQPQEFYSIGVGVDLLDVWSKLTTQSNKKSE